MPRGSRSHARAHARAHTRMHTSAHSHGWAHTRMHTSIHNHARPHHGLFSHVHRGFGRSHFRPMPILAARRPIRRRAVLRVAASTPLPMVVVLRDSASGSLRMAQQGDTPQCGPDNHDIVDLPEWEEVTFENEDGTVQVAFADSCCRRCGQHFFLSPDLPPPRDVDPSAPSAPPWPPAEPGAVPPPYVGTVVAGNQAVWPPGQPYYTTAVAPEFRPPCKKKSCLIL